MKQTTSILDAIRRELNVAYTENGDVACATSGSFCLDLFSLIGGMRNNVKDAGKLFIRALLENPVIAIKILFYARDIRNGLGERKIFRILFLHLVVSKPEIAKKVLREIPSYGRWDDLLEVLDTPLKDDAIEIIKAQLAEDEKNLKEGKEISLLGKWLPSINTSSISARHYAKVLMNGLGLKPAEYRKLCTRLRKEIKIIENNLRTKDYTFDYSKQPSQAMFKYRNSFSRNDSERYSRFLSDVQSGKETMNVKTLYPYQIVSAYRGHRYINDEDESLEAAWKSLDRDSFDSKTLVVRDGSYSMTDGPTGFKPIDVATSLTLLFAEQLKGIFKNKFITFSANPQFIEIPETTTTLKQKLMYLESFDDCSNTNIAAVYNLLLNIAVNAEVPKEEMIERVLIISDMEFDCIDSEGSTYEYYKKAFNDAGYELPEIVFWNVCARNVHTPVTKDERGVKLVSGASGNIFSSVLTGDLKEITPEQFMLQILEPYKNFDEILK